MKNTIKDIILSWKTFDDTYMSNEEILEWINELNKTLKVNIKQTILEEHDFWFYDTKKGEIRNRANSFFSIKGICSLKETKEIRQQPIIIQNEIGYLGIICKKINGILHFLIQAKIEPGNINKIQLSPTLQATKSNFTQKHGGEKPSYIEYFLNAKNNQIVIDQIQSEQSSRFYKKRNRNIIIRIDEEIPLLNNYKWMTLGQIKQLMKMNNLVNMDTRTVLSCIPFILANFNESELNGIEKMFRDKALFNSIFNKNDMKDIINIYKYINDYKMCSETITKIVSLNKLDKWQINSEGIQSKENSNFSVIYCDIEVEGREVRKWTQPLFKAEGMAMFGLFTTTYDSSRKFLVKCKEEIGCFDRIEIGPTVQLEATEEEKNEIEKLFLEYYAKDKGILYNVILSEEGGRFYHEQNKNVIIEIKMEDIKKIPEGYFWVDYKTLNLLTQINNCLNIQLRNLLSLLEV